MRTRFTDLIGCEVPLQMAPMSGVGMVDLAAAVAEAGGMAMVATVLMPPAAVTGLLDALTARTDRPFGVNFLLVLPPDRDAILIAAQRSRYVDFYHADVDAELVRLVHDGGALAGWQVNSVEQAIAAEEAGCDLVVVRGVEGGGRMHGNRPLRPLLDQTIAAIDVPVLAAGGLATGRHIADCLALGAAGVRMGTRFVATVESAAHPAYKRAIVAATADDVTVTEAFSVGLPTPGAAGVLRDTLLAAEASTEDVLGETVSGGQRVPVRRLSPYPPTRDTTGAVGAMAMYAGRSVGAITTIEPAGALTRDLVAEATSLLEA